VRWPDDIDEVLDADVVVALAYRTPAGGVVISGVSPIGLRDRDAGTVGFTTSLGFGRKLERIRRNPQVALAFHAREHGRSRRADYVLVQGTVSEVLRPDEAYLRQEIGKRSERYLGDLCPDQRPLWKRTERGNQYPSDIQREDLKTAGFRLPLEPSSAAWVKRH